MYWNEALWMNSACKVEEELKGHASSRVSLKSTLPMNEDAG